MIRTHYSNEITEKMDSEQVVVAGWIDNIRDIGKIKFVILRDREGTMQVVVKEKDMTEKIKHMGKESVISVKGVVQASDKSPCGWELIPEDIEMLNKSETTLPLEVKESANADLDTRLNARVLDLRKPSVTAIFKIRSKILEGGREYFTKNKFVEIHTPRIISTASEGGTDLFPISYFDKEAFLAQSPQLFKQMIMGTGFDKIFEIATYFRAEEHKTIWHLNEITAIDCEMAFINSEDDILDVLEGMTKYIVKFVADNCKEELKVLKVKVDAVDYDFPRLTYTEALKLLSKEGIELPWGEDLDTAAEKKIGEIMKKKGFEFYFITKYPMAIKPFYTMPEPGNDKISRGFDLEFRGRELVSGSQRIHDREFLMKQLKKKGMNPEALESYLDAFKYGMPPHGGFGFGIERIVMLLLGLSNIREAVLFPRDRTRINP
ncbi:aspartate--tRNA(Asn) ligase [archaeon]|nr:aspartate--tRNA(Asn) ligase [archaeon]